MSERAIADTSALIALEKINLLDVLCRIYTTIILPEAVINEFGTPPIKCYSTTKVESPLVRLFVGDLNLGKGEAEVIAMSVETGLTAIIDDLKARRVAETLGLKITGTIGIILKAEKMGLIKSSYDKTIELRDKGFFVSDKVLEDILKFRRNE